MSGAGDSGGGGWGKVVTHLDAAASCYLSSPGVTPLEVYLTKVEDAAISLAQEFGALVSSYEEHASRAGRATLECSTALLQGTVFLEEQLREAMALANGVVEGMTGIAAAVKGMEDLLSEARKVAQDVSLVEDAIKAAEAAKGRDANS
ncbi:hypothetical protein TcYC6_0109000 [Trypanosoma cruzi]|uniref:Uncharacterized protein n=1 Tax=Trypanosoma cruzi (strain CL Brener) TaxID=353153 RepID=Q4D718_TRYCC|nr:hypothetical protein Tc00.1047053504431.20 [Trypanosoma cruzi]EAN88312.1 hypothetical protein Tc00.1047053504431.20 [Trypanosoma cruzi]KAF8293182.1 hypothetical protein TcYC6_0109000 [Trypanosoma cruzi]RNC59669.1 hypothetical protein TcCL_ESM02729 [Trypanosoma cruzi]|eukprot:XP_810163.1 hypothetical protein [Trypanosoma cruzi strain CL Brener]